jgi:hypothetical protein
VVFGFGAFTLTSERRRSDLSLRLRFAGSCRRFAFTSACATLTASVAEPPAAFLVALL